MILHGAGKIRTNACHADDLISLQHNGFVNAENFSAFFDFLLDCLCA